MKTKLAEQKARDGAALSSKQEKLKAERLTSKELLSSKDTLLKESEKTRTRLQSDLAKQVNSLKKATEAITNLRSTSSELQDQKQLVKSLQAALNKANNVDRSQATAKIAHEKSIAELKLQN